MMARAPLKTTPTWLERAALLQDFTVTHGRLPSATAHAPSEQHIFFWLQNQRADARKKGAAFQAERGAWLDAHIPDWTISRDELWERTAEELLAFVTTHGRIPSNRRPDHDEARLSAWLVKQRQAARGVGAGIRVPARVIWLDRNVPGWDEGRKPRPPLRPLVTLAEAEWLVPGCTEAPRYVVPEVATRVSGRLPLYDFSEILAAAETGDDLARHGTTREYALGCGCLACREAKGQSHAASYRESPAPQRAMPPERSAALVERAREQQARTVAKATSRSKPWTDEDLAIALDYTHTATEAALLLGRTKSAIAHKRANHRARPERLPYRMRESTAAAAEPPRPRARKPRDTTTDDTRWQATADAVIAFMRDTGRPPRRRAEREEARLAKWVQRQKDAARTDPPALPEWRKRWLERHLPGHPW